MLSSFLLWFYKKLLLRTQLIWLFQLLICTAQWDGVMVTQSDYQSLQAFKRELIDTEGFLKSWNDSGEGACSGGWIGVKCAQGQVIVIQLPWKGLGGKISESIGQFQALRKLSLHDNLLQGPIPLSLGFLRNLRGIQLFNNKLSGSIPHSLGSCPLLQTLDFSNNSLTGEIPGGIFGSANLSGLNLSFNSLFGSIPSEIGRLYKLTTLDLSNAGINGSLPVSLSNLSSLSVLNLQGNRLSGQIPATFGRISSLTELDLAYNNLSGEIPSSLGDLPKLAYFNASYNNFSGSVPTHLYQKFNSSSFVGNLHLCGYTASTPCPPPASPAHIPGRSAETNRTHHRRHDSRNIIFIGFGIFIVVVLCFLVLCYLTRKTAVSKVKDSQPGGKAGRARPEKGGEGGGETGGKLVRFEGPVALTEEGLFSAMAEALGKSTYGTAYKATMEDGKQLAVKRLRAKLTKSRKELEAEVKLLGKIRHPNLLALRAYYFGPRGDKLLVFDFMPRGSLARLLHAQRPGMPLDWPTRVKIVRGTAQGLLYLHAHVKIVHGNLTSSNVLLDEQ
ncbi:Non-specific serine/threonine protein kinase [Bertholletia excelsa]